MKTFRVGTFCVPGEARKSLVSAYVEYRNEWPSEWCLKCVEYEIEASSGAEAKKMAIAKRLELERNR